MSQSPDRTLEGIVLRLSVPFEGELRVVASDLVPRIVDYFKERAPAATVVHAAIDHVARSVAPASGDAMITFDFREANGELLIEAHCGSRSSEVRCPLPA